MADVPPDISTHVKDYTYAELLMILQLTDVEGADPNIIVQRADSYIARYNREGNSRMSAFFADIKDALLSYVDETEEGEEYIGPEAEQARVWNDNLGAIPQDDPLQTDKNTDRFQKIDVFNNNYAPMTREQLGVNNTHEVDVVQDGKLNPTLENTTQRIVVIDSLFRQEAASGNVSTDFTLDLSDKLTSVLNMRLWSVQVPITFYAIDEVYGNTCFWISDTTNNQDIPVSIAPGNYTPADFVNALNDAFAAAGFFFPGPNTPVSYNIHNYKVTLSLDGGSYTPPPDSPFVPGYVTTNSIITFFDPNKPLVCQESCIPQALHSNSTLGWLMGFQEKYAYPVLPIGNVGDAVLDLSGPRYLILAVDDFTQNHFNDGLVTITEPSKIVKLPSYYTTDHPLVCVDSANGPVPELVNSSPRTLTQTQLYTINEIIKNNVNNLDVKAKAPATTSVLAIIPVKQQNKGALYVEFSGSLQNNKRVYFGPVDIERMRVRLLDDRGNTLNLNGANWSFTLLCEMLYQY